MSYSTLERAPTGEWPTRRSPLHNTHRRSAAPAPRARRCSTISYYTDALASLEEAPLKPPLELALYELLTPGSAPNSALGSALVTAPNSGVPVDVSGVMASVMAGVTELKMPDTALKMLSLQVMSPDVALMSPLMSPDDS